MPELGESLSQRELDVLQCLTRGAANKEIAAELSISQNTVKVHLRNIYTKLGVSSRTEATTAAYQAELVEIPGMERGQSAVVGEQVSVTSEQSTVVSEQSAVVSEQSTHPESPTSNLQPEVEQSPISNPSTHRNKYLVGLLLLLGVAVLVLLTLVLRQPDGLAPTPEPYEETAVANSHWARSRPLPAPHTSIAIAALGLNVYQVGGETAKGVSNALHIFDSQTRSWLRAANKPTAVADGTAVELFDQIYVVGGRLADGTSTHNVEAYSPSQDAWRTISPLPQAVSGGLALTDGAFLYYFGGWNGKEFLNIAYVYDPSTDGWRPLPPMPQSLAYAAGGALTGSLYVVGGFDGKNELDSCFLFDIVDEKWESCSPMLSPRATAGGTVIFNKLYIIGGGFDANSNVTFSEVYDPKTGIWQVVNTPMLETTSSWTNPGVTHIEARIYVIGGQQNDELLDDTFVYTPLAFQTFIPAASSGSEE